MKRREFLGLGISGVVGSLLTGCNTVRNVAEFTGSAARGLKKNVSGAFAQKLTKEQMRELALKESTMFVKVKKAEKGTAFSTKRLILEGRKLADDKNVLRALDNVPGTKANSTPGCYAMVDADTHEVYFISSKDQSILNGYAELVVAGKGKTGEGESYRKVIKGLLDKNKDNIPELKKKEPKKVAPLTEVK